MKPEDQARRTPLPGQRPDRPGDTFHDDRHPDLEADHILANQPFNVSDAVIAANLEERGYG